MVAAEVRKLVEALAMIINEVGAVVEPVAMTIRMMLIDRKE